MINLDQKITFADTIFAQEIDGEMVLLDMNSENYFGLDAIGTAIWQAIQEKETLQEVYDTILEQYDVEPKILEKDLFVFVTKLEESGLISPLDN